MKIGTITINGKDFPVYRNHKTPYGAFGHVCEIAEDIGWNGPTAELPDMKGSYFNAPIMFEKSIAQQFAKGVI